MSAFIYLAILAALIAVGPFAVLFVVEKLADRGAEYHDGLTAPEALRQVPESTLDSDRRPSLAAVRSLPSPHLSVVPDPPVADDIEWVFAADLFNVPQQRRPGGAS